MCGIVGVLGRGIPAERRMEMIEGLLYAASSRGTDATGIGCLRDGMPFVIKDALAAGKFVYGESLKPLEDDPPEIWIGHARKTTKGSEKQNVNNHPVFSKDTGLLLVHNGSVNDLKWRAKNAAGENPYMLCNFDGDVDTEAILRLAETLLYIPREENLDINPDVVEATPKSEWRRSVSMMEALDDTAYNLDGGGFAVAVMDPEEPNVLYLMRHSQPIYVAYLPQLDSVAFASTEKILQDGLRKDSWTTYFGVFAKKVSSDEEYYGYEVPDDTLVRIELGVDGDVLVEQRTLECGAKVTSKTLGVTASANTKKVEEKSYSNSYYRD